MKSKAGKVPFFEARSLIDTLLLCLNNIYHLLEQFIVIHNNFLENIFEKAILVDPAKQTLGRSWWYDSIFVSSRCYPHCSFVFRNKALCTTPKTRTILALPSVSIQRVIVVQDWSRSGICHLQARDQHHPCTIILYPQQKRVEKLHSL